MSIVPEYLVNDMIETFTLVVNLLEEHRITSALKSGHPDHLMMVMWCVRDADFAVKMQYGYEMRDLLPNQV